MTTEVSITGTLPAALYSAVLERLSSFGESGSAFTLTEQVFGRTASSATILSAVDVLGPSAATYVKVKALRLRSQKAGEAQQWTIQVNQRPEPQRTAPRAMQHGVNEFATKEGSHPAALVRSLGFRGPTFSLHSRGVRFQRGQVLIDVFQLFESPEAANPLDAANYVVTASARFSSAQPVARPSSGAPGPPQPSQGGSTSSAEVREAALTSIEQVAGALKGLVDLSRVD
ncbi:hypothetical protein JCM11641_001493 [Rhodosporidiobolus odoratus]